MFMAKCSICGKSEEEVSLYEGVGKFGISKFCYSCSNKENIALVKKPSPEQLAEAEKRKTVREVMEKMSFGKKVQNENRVIHKNLSKLKIPHAKESHGDLVENYDWILKQARRRAKMSTAQISELAKIDKVQYESLESGSLFSGFQSVASSVENILKIKILKTPNTETALIPSRPIKSKRIEETEKDILESVRQKMGKHKTLVEKAKTDGIDFYEDIETEYGIIDIDEIAEKKKRQKEDEMERIERELIEDEFDFSKKENLENITIQDLVELKKNKRSKTK